MFENFGVYPETKMKKNGIFRKHYNEIFNLDAITLIDETGGVTTAVFAPLHKNIHLRRFSS